MDLLDVNEKLSLIINSLYVLLYIYIAKFWGFKQTESEFRSFKFRAPEMLPSATTTTTSSSTTASSNISQLGQIKVTIHEAVVTDGLFDNKCGQFTVPGVAPVTEQSGVKFWMQPSVRQLFLIVHYCISILLLLAFYL